MSPTPASPARPPPPPPPPAMKAEEDDFLDPVHIEFKEESEERSSTSPLKAAADLIQTLDIAFAEMTHCAADAAKDAEEARRNARTASEIARRYLHRSFPKVKSNFGEASSPRTRSSCNNMRQEEQKESASFSDHFNHLNHLNGTSNHSLSAPTVLAPPSPRRLYTTSSVSPNRSHRARTNQFHSSADRIAQSHADDVLALSLELERTKQAFQSEQRMHDETKAGLSSQKVKAHSLEEENKRLKEQMAQIEKKNAEQVAQLEHDLAKSKHMAQAAEEDASLALDLAKESSEKRDEMEREYQQLLQQWQAWKEQPLPHVETPRRAVRFADEQNNNESTAVDMSIVENTPQKTQTSTPSRTMVATGRHLLRRNQAASPNDQVIQLELTPAKAAERRRRFCERLAQLEDTASAPLLLMPAAAPPPPSPRKTSELEDCRNAAKILQESGRRLELSGHWWRKGHAVVSHLLEIEAMTRQYCQSVEFKVERQYKEIKELESLCGFLERKLVTGEEHQE